MEASYPPTPIQRLQSLRRRLSTIGTMILWEGRLDVPNWGLAFSLFMGSSSYVASPAWNDQNDPATSHGLGIMQRSVSPQFLPEVQAGTWWLPCSSSGTLHQLPGRRATTLPAPVTASMVPTESPSFLLSPWAAPLFYCAEVTLHLHDTSAKSCQW